MTGSVVGACPVDLISRHFRKTSLQKVRQNFTHFFGDMSDGSLEVKEVRLNLASRPTKNGPKARVFFTCVIQETKWRRQTQPKVHW